MEKSSTNSGNFLLSFIFFFKFLNQKKIPTGQIESEKLLQKKEEVIRFLTIYIEMKKK